MDLVLSFLLSVIISISAYYKKSLSLSGTVAGFFTFFIHLYAGTSIGLFIITFFITSSILTKVGKDKKKRIEAKYQKEIVQEEWVILLEVIRRVSNRLPCQ
ncbi:hypothetical protein EIN_359440 [Entamoeba invadens IP1]|uniref:Uncharacterized protein n=1 Tax=Entamoeba invadens IP1 TaxID=370355 RepID=A0A0A1UB83_ENTIV|nr:hypothetical protein EIN_359440 [Entamoeba invadens IP1]ELP90861.1 hypothetical protein EIN_359440 [Entamoeba invadens IP1]|eukprot:XP_004257632.1 hypothetical protein EIN_359440 [Entamoeba invadens IP1]